MKTKELIQFGAASLVLLLVVVTLILCVVFIVVAVAARSLRRAIAIASGRPSRPLLIPVINEKLIKIIGRTDLIVLRDYNLF